MSGGVLRLILRFGLAVVGDRLDRFREWLGGRRLAVPLGLGDERVGGLLCLVVFLAPARQHLDVRGDDFRLPMPRPRSSSQDRVCNRPSTATCWPFPRYVPAISARRSQVTTFEYSAFSRPPLRYSLLATVKVVTLLPLARLRISGSRVRRPVRKTLFTVDLLPGRPDAPVPTLRSGGLSAGR